MSREQNKKSDRETIYGRQPVYETLKAGRRKVFKLAILSTVKQSDDLDAIIALARASGVSEERVDRNQLNNLSENGNHQGVALKVSRYQYVPFKDLISKFKDGKEPPFVLILDHLQDPQNLGSLLRTAEAAGVNGIIIPKDRAAGVTPAVVRASAGASEHVNVSLVANLVQTMKALKDEGLWFTGLEAVPEAVLFDEADLTGSTGIVVGSEGKGLGRLVRETCDFLVKLPLQGKIGSLNAGVAGAIVLYEVRRQRSIKST